MAAAALPNQADPEQRMRTIMNRNVINATAMSTILADPQLWFR